MPAEATPAVRCRSISASGTSSGAAWCSSSASLLVIPSPWVATWFYRWIVSRLYVPGRPNLAFTGQPLDIWYVFIAIGILTYVGSADLYYLQYLSIPIQAVLSWMVIRWIASNLSSNGQPLPIAFNGSALGYVGWQVLLYVSVHHHCRLGLGDHGLDALDLPQHQTARSAKSSSLASGLEVLWRTIVFVIACIFIIPIPWMLRWYAQWYASQFALAERGTVANAWGAACSCRWAKNGRAIRHDARAHTGGVGRKCARRRYERARVTCAGAPSLPGPPTPPACRRA